MEYDERVYFLPGERVTLRQDVPNKPTMIVVKKKTKTMKTLNESNSYFQGMICMWFTQDGYLQEHVFSTKDLIKI